MNKNNFNIVKTKLSELCLLNHDFYKILWNQGLLSKNDLRYYAEQYYFIEENFLNGLKKMQSLYVNNREFINIVEENIADETGRNNPNNSHLELWKKFTLFCGSNEIAIQNSEKHQKILELIDDVNKLIEQSIPSAVGVAYAYEWQIPEIAKSKMHGLLKFYGAKKNSSELTFFKEHQIADIWHTKQWEKLIKNFNTQEFQEFEESATKTSQLLLGFLDGVIQKRNLKC